MIADDDTAMLKMLAEVDKTGFGVAFDEDLLEKSEPTLAFLLKIFAHNIRNTSFHNGGYRSLLSLYRFTSKETTDKIRSCVGKGGR